VLVTGLQSSQYLPLTPAASGLSAR
jgi:hypothetical protein